MHRHRRLAQVLCDPAITVRTISREMRELLFYGYCGRKDILRLRHLHKIAAEFEHQRSFDIAAVNPVNDGRGRVEATRPGTGVPSAGQGPRQSGGHRSLPPVGSLAQRPECSHLGGRVAVRCRLQWVDDILRFARMDCSGLWVPGGSDDVTAPLSCDRARSGLELVENGAARNERPPPPRS
jgi:hypothetical protein